MPRLDSRPGGGSTFLGDDLGRWWLDGRNCFRAGCVSVYVGPKEIADLVPADCFVDGRAFLLSPAARPFNQEHFADVVVATILADLKVAGA